MNFRKILTISLFSLSFAVYQVGDQISQQDQDRIFDVCYGMEEHGYFENCTQYTNEDDCFSYGAEPYEDLNENGSFDEFDEPYDDLAEPYDDLNGNGRWDEGEPYEDLNENGSFDLQNGTWDEGEPFEDLNGNGTWDQGEPYDDLYDNNMWDSGFGCEWINNQCREFPVMSLKDYNGFINETGIFYVLMIDMAASW